MITIVTIRVMMDNLFFVEDDDDGYMHHVESGIFVHTANYKFKDISTHRFEAIGLRHEKNRDAPEIKK